VKNLVLFGATNRLSSMDDTFLRRMPAKFFVGRPSFDARREWIQWKMLQHGLPIGSIKMRQKWMELEAQRKMEAFATASKALHHKHEIPQECNKGIDFLVGLTINFSNDAMQLLLIMLHETRYSQDLSNDIDAIDEKELSWVVKHICHAQRIYLGNRIVPDIKKEAKLPPLDTLRMKRIKAMDDLCKQDAARVDTEQAIKAKNSASLPRRESSKGKEKEPQQPQSATITTATHHHLLPCCTHRMLVNFNTKPEDQFTFQLMEERDLEGEEHHRIFETYTDPHWWHNKSPRDMITALFECLKLDRSTAPYPDMTQKLVVITQERGYKVRDLRTVEDLTNVIHATTVLYRRVLDKTHGFYRILAEALKAWAVMPPLSVENSQFFQVLNIRMNTVAAAKEAQHKDTVKDVLLCHPAGEAFLNDCFVLLKDSNMPSGHKQARLDNVIAHFSRRQDAFLATAFPMVGEFLRRWYSKRYFLQSFGAIAPEPLGYEDALSVLIDRAISCKLEAVYLVDNATLIHHGHIEDSSAQQYLNHVLEEARNYQRSMVIFDLDSLANVSKSFQSLTQESAEALLLSARRETFFTGGRGNKGDDNSNLNDETFSFGMQRPNLLAMVLQEIVQSTSKNNLFWMVAMTEDLVLTSRFKQMFTTDQWPLVLEERENEETQRELRKQKLCKRCKKSYTEMENEPDSCSMHQMHLCVALKNAKDNPPLLMTLEEFAQRLMDPSTNQFALNVESVKWLCCQRGPWDQGEIPCPHDPQL